jgi:cell division protein FtsB
LAGAEGVWQGRCVVPVQLLTQRVLPLVVIVVAACSVPVMIFSPSGLGRLRALEEEKRRADDEVQRVSREIERLRAEVQRIKDDPTHVERAARDEIGLVRQTELVFQFKR